MNTFTQEEWLDHLDSEPTDEDGEPTLFDPYQPPFDFELECHYHVVLEVKL